MYNNYQIILKLKEKIRTELMNLEFGRLSSIERENILVLNNDLNAA